MKQATREWVAKAEEDFLAAVDLARRRKRPVWSTVCFHAQQCAEKYLKARMEEAGLPIPRTHDLEVLLNPLLPIEPLWAALRAALQTNGLRGGLPISRPNSAQKSRPASDAALQVGAA